MFSLQLPIELQNRVNEYYDITTESTLNYDKKAFDMLNHFLREKIVLIKSIHTFKGIWKINDKKKTKMKQIAEYLEIEHFQAGDIILKQGEIGDKICFIIDGLTEVILENEDYRYYHQTNVDNFYGRKTLNSNEDKQLNYNKKNITKEFKNANNNNEKSFNNLFKEDKIYGSSSEWSSSKSKLKEK